MTADGDISASLLKRAAAGDQTAVEDLLALHRDRLKRMVRLRLSRRLSSRVDDSDVVQESLAECAGRLSDYFADPKSPFYLWLRHMTGLKLSEIHRRHLGKRSCANVDREVTLCTAAACRKRDSVSLAAHLLGQLTTPSKAAVKAETRLVVQEALNNMDPIDREVRRLTETLRTTIDQRDRGSPGNVQGGRRQPLSPRHQTTQSDSVADTRFHRRRSISRGWSWQQPQGGHMSSSESNSGAVVELAEEFIERCRKGERPSLQEYIDRYPELAAEIREVFPAVALMENIAVADEVAGTGPGKLGPDKPTWTILRAARRLSRHSRDRTRRHGHRLRGRAGLAGPACRAQSSTQPGPEGRQAQTPVRA